MVHLNPAKKMVTLLSVTCLILAIAARGQSVSGPEQLDVVPVFANIGNSLTARCSSRELEPGRTLVMRWTVSENNVNTTLGECRSVHPGLTDMYCDPGIGVTEPYADGLTAFATSTITHTPEAAPVVFFCQFGHGERRAFSPKLRVSPTIENLRIVCNEQTYYPELRWESPQGGVDYYQVNLGSGWVDTTETPFQLGANRFNHYDIRVRAVSNQYGAGRTAPIIGFDDYGTPSVNFNGCASAQFRTTSYPHYFPINITIALVEWSITTYFLPIKTLMLYEAYRPDLATDLNIQNVLNYQTRYRVEIFASWRCGGLSPFLFARSISSLRYRPQSKSRSSLILTA